MTKICLYAICGDNERDEDLDRWFECAYEADGAVLVHTGSDETMWKKLEERTLKSAHAHLHREKFDPFRFDVARNRSIELAEDLFPTFDVFFTIDMDEWMAPGWTETIKAGWDPEKHQRIFYAHRHFEAEKPAGRNWGHAKGWRWKNACHEVMIRGLHGDIWYAGDECLDLADELEVVHYRDPSKPRDSYLGLLELRWEESKDPATLAYLVREYYYHGEWDEIIGLSTDVERICTGEGSESCMAWCILGLAYEHVEEKLSAKTCYERSMKLGHMFRRGYVEYGRWLIKHEDYDKAVEVLIDGLHKTEFTQHAIFLDPPDLWTWRYLDWLCVACYWAGKPLEAMGYSLEALRADPENPHVLRNLDESYHLLKETGK